MYSDSTERIRDTEKENNESVTIDARSIRKISEKDSQKLYFRCVWKDSFSKQEKRTVTVNRMKHV